MKKLFLALAFALLCGAAVFYVSKRVKVTVERPPENPAAASAPAAPPVDPPLVEALQRSLRNADSENKIAGLLKEGADPNAVDVKGYPAIYWAIVTGDEKALGLMIKAGADLNKIDAESHWTPLMHAAYYAARDPKLARLTELLLDSHANPNGSSNGITALHVAITNGEDSESGASVVKMLLKKGANPDGAEPGLSPLMEAARTGKIILAKTLVQGGAHIDLKSPGGKTAQAIALENKHPELAQALAQASQATVKKTKPAAKPKKKHR